MLKELFKTEDIVNTRWIDIKFVFWSEKLNFHHSSANLTFKIKKFSILTILYIRKDENFLFYPFHKLGTLTQPSWGTGNNHKRRYEICFLAGKSTNGLKKNFHRDFWQEGYFGKDSSNI